MSTKKQKERRAKKDRYELARFMRENYPIEKVRSYLAEGTPEQAAGRMGVELDVLNVVIAYYKHKKEL